MTMNEERRLREARELIEQIERRMADAQRLRVITLPGGIERSASRLDIDIDEALILKALWQYLARVSAMRRIHGQGTEEQCAETEN